jgi:protein-S-isoprenylcysteine O-methyltransferase Ste14
LPSTDRASEDPIVSETSSSAGQELHAPAWLVGLALGAGLAMFAAILLVPAGRLDWHAAWIYLGILTAFMIANLVYLRRVNPELIARRTRLARGTKRWDVAWSVLFSPLFIAVYVVAGLDAGRHGWSSMPGWMWLVGLALFLAGTALFARAMGENPFFEKTVRIQSDRGHRVVETGPYRLVRHPGYLGFFGWILSTPLLLGSWWALAPAFLSVAGIVVRTALEDRTLQAELPGYADYAKSTRYRLLPGLW